MGHRRQPGRSIPVSLFLTAFAVAALSLTGAVPAAADPPPDPKAAGQAVARAEAVLETATATARRAASQLEVATAALPAAHAKVATTRGLVAAARAEANTARRQAVSTRRLYGAVAFRYNQARIKVADARERVDQIAAASYMGGSFSQVNVLVAATSPQDMLDRLGLVDQVMQKQNADVDTLTAARQTARAEQDRAGLTKRAADAAEQAARSKLTGARAAELAAERARTAVVNLTTARAQALADAKSQRAAVLAKYEQAKAEEARIRDALRAHSAKGGSSGPYIGGVLLMPVDGWKSSEFGERFDPYYRVWQLHAGTDFAAAGGTPIHAAASGRVIQTGWNGGYGNYTCLDHGEFEGEDFSTCYGHQSQILVEVGDYVARGDVIGRVGTTGASTGNHLHFETRFDGTPKDPLQYLPPCLC